MIIHLFPAHDGDCLLLKSREGAGATSILVDGGRLESFKNWKVRLSAALAPAIAPDLLVVTHVDADHIGGVLSMLQAPDTPPISAAWFNAYPHVREAIRTLKLEPFGVEQGDKLSRRLAELDVTLNESFEGGPVMLSTAAEPAVHQIGEIALRLLSPDAKRLAKIEATWKKWLTTEGMLEDGPDPAPMAPGYEAFGPSKLDVDELAAKKTALDKTTPNGTSIAFLAELGEKRVLLAGDAHPDMLEASVRAIAKGGRLKVDLLKIAHHGSSANTTAQLLSMIDCQKFAFSSDGSRHHHPDPETVARVLKSTSAGKTLYFNYRQPQTLCWEDAELQDKFSYDVKFGDEDGHLVVTV